MLEQKFTLPFPNLQVRAGVLVADGYGVALRVRYGRLHVEDGIGACRRSIVLSRTGSGLQRIVLLGKTGVITLEALAWLRAVGAALVHISPDGAVLTHSVPFGYEVEPLRRAQALATTSGLDVILSRDLLDRKLTGQRTNLVRLASQHLTVFDSLHVALRKADTIEAARLCEAKAAAIYWHAWRKVPIHVRGRDLLRMPAQWVRYDSRMSALTGKTRAATNPVNAMLNYLYALLESESRLAVLAAGLDPTLGILHADRGNRDSFALDVLEPIRPTVDELVLEMLARRTFSTRDFVELPNGVCRLRAPLTHELALTLPRWRSLLAPVVSRLAQSFRSPIANRDQRTTNRRPIGDARNRVVSLLPRKTIRIGSYAGREWTAARPEAFARVPAPCAICGNPIIKRRRRHCEECLPKARRARAERAIEKARTVLVAQARQGHDPRASAEACRKRGTANADQHRRNREWRREHQGNTAVDKGWFLREITPMLEAFSLMEIARVTALSLAACSRIRAGMKVPHPRHWPAFVTLLRQNGKGVG